MLKDQGTSLLHGIRGGASDGALTVGVSKEIILQAGVAAGQLRTGVQGGTSVVQVDDALWVVAGMVEGGEVVLS